MILVVVSLSGLPIAQYPDVAPPTVQVIANYPGANAVTVAGTVATPIELEVNGVRLTTGDAVLLEGESLLGLTQGKNAEVLVFDLQA